MNIMNTVVLEEDPASGEIFLPLTNDMLSVLNCKENDTVNIVDNGDGSFNISKASTDITMPSEDWSDIQRECFKNWLNNVLINNVITVIFTKKDGTERVMKCTLKSSLLPKKEVKEAKVVRKQSDNILSVYDLEAHDWRSFTVSSVKSVSFTLD